VTGIVDLCFTVVLSIVGGVVANRISARALGWSRGLRRLVDVAGVAVGLAIGVAFVVVTNSAVPPVPDAGRVSAPRDTTLGTSPEFVRRVAEPRQCGSVGVNQAAQTGWGPDRATYTLHPPSRYPDHPAFNSITDTPDFGDERMWLEVKPTGYDKLGGFCSSLVVNDGDLLLLQAYVENSGADERGGPNGSATAVGTRLRFTPDRDVSSLRHVTAFLTAANADPHEVYSTMELAAPYPIELVYVRQSAAVYSNATPRGWTADDALWGSSGAAIGNTGPDGVVQPGYQYSMIVTAEVRVTRTERSG